MNAITLLVLLNIFTILTIAVSLTYITRILHKITNSGKIYNNSIDKRQIYTKYDLNDIKMPNILDIPKPVNESWDEGEVSWDIEDDEPCSNNNDINKTSLNHCNLGFLFV
jgi:hypothetical protein